MKKNIRFTTIAFIILALLLSTFPAWAGTDSHVLLAFPSVLSVISG
jgi:hypothetical protein